MSDSWKLTLPCTRAEAEILAEDIAPLAGLDPPPVLMTSEPDPDAPDAWRLDAYFEGKPDAATVELLHGLVPSAAAVKPALARLPDADWVTLSQQGLEPVRAGRFFVHTAQHAEAPPPGAVAFRIDAGLAFGTGQHETTTGCLQTLDRLKRRGARFRNLLDLGTGTGLLAFAAMRLWPLAYATASDIDPIAIRVSAENAAINRIPLGADHGRLALAVADGLDDPLLAANAPYDLIIANILAQPLIAMAGPVAGALAPGGTLILAGLLDSQAAAVAAAYRRHGLRLAGRIDNRGWPTLRMVKRRR
ncbi:50S ribosomal protein L11 methyltransferase [Sphingomonas flavalba]|uniref:50S ribosomal protein L11 methyltransferase n=1 Tax=Sphingomonas flavalba TaxID=2559804 RepID=UPI00109E05BB|nr:50S ribosomal protein L11 methyltransferase [Sphingomonas flavalba]